MVADISDGGSGPAALLQASLAMVGVLLRFLGGMALLLVLLGDSWKL